MDVQDSADIFLVEVQGSQGNLWEVDGTDRCTFVQVLGQDGTDLDTDGGLCFLGGATDVWSQDDVLQGLQLVDERKKLVAVEIWAVCSWLLRIDVNTGASQLADSQCLNEGRDVDDSASRVVDQICTVFHFGQLWSGDHLLSFWGLWNVE